MVELGNKHECVNCGTKFYDLGKKELICPSCETNQAEAENEADSGKPKRSGASKKSKSKKSKKKAKKSVAKAKSKKSSADDEELDDED